MAERTVYITVRLDVSNPSFNEITDEIAEEIVNEMDYRFSLKGWVIETEICGINE
jgi:hypothetical protein